MRRLFKVDSGFHGRGKVTFAWQPDGNYLATAGSNGLVHVFGRTGEQVDEISLSASGRVLAGPGPPEPQAAMRRALARRCDMAPG